MEVGPLRFRLSLPEDLKSGLLRMLFINIPLMISHVVRKDLGSQKLAVQLRNEGLAKSVTVAFLQTGLYADLKLPEFIEELEKLHTRLKGSNLFLQVMLAKLRDIFVRFNIKDDEEKPFRDLVTEVGADAKGLKGKARIEYKTTLLGDMRRDELISRFRRNSS